MRDLTVFRRVLGAQWLWARLALVVLAVVGFAIPLASVFYGADLNGAGISRVGDWLVGADRVARVLPYFALLTGVLVGVMAWTPDITGRHVYALTLPVSRAYFVTMRFLAGALLTLVPAGAFALGAALSSLAVTLPPAVHAHPVEVAARFWLATLTVYAIIFAISSASRRGQIAIISVIGGAILVDLLLLAIGSDFSVTAETFALLTNWPGPLAILAGRWALFDV
jgi:hypothetical protein